MISSIFRNGCLPVYPPDPRTAGQWRQHHYQPSRPTIDVGNDGWSVGQKAWRVIVIYKTRNEEHLDTPAMYTTKTVQMYKSKSNIEKNITKRT